MATKPKKPSAGALDQYPSLKQVDGETNKAYAAFLDYVAMGNGRSVLGLLRQYEENRLDNAQKAPAITVREKTLYGWSDTFDWKGRLANYLKELAAEIALENQEYLMADTRLARENYSRAQKEIDDMLKQFQSLRITKRTVTQDPNDPSRTLDITRLKVNTVDLHRLIAAMTHLHKETAALLGGARSASIKIETPGSGINGSGEHGSKIKAYISISADPNDPDDVGFTGPGDWDDPPQKTEDKAEDESE